MCARFDFPFAGPYEDFFLQNSLENTSIFEVTMRMSSSCRATLFFTMWGGERGSNSEWTEQKKQPLTLPYAAPTSTPPLTTTYSPHLPASLPDASNMIAPIVSKRSLNKKRTHFVGHFNPLNHLHRFRHIDEALRPVAADLRDVA